MPRASAPPAALAVALLVLLTTTAGPVDADSVRPLAEGSMQGAGWIAVTLLLQDSKVWVRAVGAISSDHHARGVVELDANGTMLSARAAWDEALAHVSAGSNATAPVTGPMVPVVDSPTLQRSVRESFVVNRSGTTTIVVWMAGDIKSWSWEIIGAPGAGFVGMTTGSGAFLHGAHDFDTPLYARAAASEASARANAASNLTIDAQRTLLAFFHAEDGLAETASVTTPSGRRTDCPCWLSSADALPGSGGRYTFHLDGVRASSTGDVVVTGADVVLPQT